VSAVQCLRGVLGPSNGVRLSHVGPSGTRVQDAGRPEKRGGDQPPRGGDGYPERGAPGPTSDPGAGWTALVNRVRVYDVGRLQTDADRERVVDGLGRGDSGGIDDIAATIVRLAPRWFVLRDAHASDAVKLLNPRHAMTLLRGPMTKTELRRARGAGEAEGGDAGAVAVIRGEGVAGRFGKRIDAVAADPA
jgi:hypothetical protein